MIKPKEKTSITLFISHILTLNKVRISLLYHYVGLSEAATGGVLKNSAKFLGKHLCRTLFSKKVACPRPATLLKERVRHRCLPVNFAKLLRTPFLFFFKNTSGRLLLDFEYIWDKVLKNRPCKTFGRQYLKNLK